MVFLKTLGCLLGVFWIAGIKIPSLNIAIWAAIVSSVLTALFTALFNGMAERLEKKHEKISARYEKHCNTLVQLEHASREFADILTDNIFILERFIEASSHSAIIALHPHPLPRDRETLRDLLDLDLVNNEVDLMNDARKFNDDISGIQELVDELRLALLNGQKTPADLKFYFDRVNELNSVAGKRILLAGKKMVEDNIKITAYIKLRLNKDMSKINSNTKKLISDLEIVTESELNDSVKDVKNEIKQRTKERTEVLNDLYKEMKP